MFQTERNGVQINDPLTMVDNNYCQYALAMENDGKTAIAVTYFSGNYLLYRFNIDSSRRQLLP